MRGLLAAVILAATALAGCSAGPGATQVHVAGPVPDLESALQQWGAASGATFERGETAMLQAHAATLEPDDVASLTQQTFGHDDRGWYVLFVQARAPDPWVLSWAIHPEPIIVVFLPAVQDTAEVVAALGHSLEATQIAQWAMLHAGGHLSGRDGCVPPADCGIMDAAFSHGLLLLDRVRADGLSTPSFPTSPTGPSVTARRPV